MYVILRDGTVIENATILGVGPGDDPCLSFYIVGDGYEATWFDPNRIQMIRFDRDTVLDPPPEPGPDDFRIGTRHDPVAAIFAEDRLAEDRLAKDRPHD